MNRQLIKIFYINGFKSYQIYLLYLSLVFVKNSRSQKSFVVGVLVLVVLYEANINMVILPYLSGLLVLIQNLD